MKLYHNFNCFFLEKKCLFFFKGRFGVLVLRLPGFFFIKIDTNDNFSFFFAEVLSFTKFLASFFSSYNSSFSIFFFRLKLRGLGYRIKKMGKFIARVFLGMTNFFYIHIPKGVLLNVRRRRIIFVGYNLAELKDTFIGVLFLKRLIPYELRGIFFPRQVLLLKPGKKKF